MSLRVVICWLALFALMLIGLYLAPPSPIGFKVWFAGYIASIFAFYLYGKLHLDNQPDSDLGDRALMFCEAGALAPFWPIVLASGMVIALWLFVLEPIFTFRWYIK